MSRFRPYNRLTRAPGETGTPEARPQRASGPYFLLLAVDSDREIRIPMSSWGLYQNLREGRPARLRKCKVMIRTFGRELSEAIGRDWNGPISVAKLERRRDTIPTGIVSSEDYHAAVAAVELFFDVMSTELNKPQGDIVWRTCILDSGDSDVDRK